MTQKRLILALIVVAVVGIGAFLGFHSVFSPAPGITSANFERLRTQMTVAQVEQLFGGPCHEKVALEPGDFAEETQIWRLGEDTVRVSFTKQGWVCGGTATFAGRSHVLVHHETFWEMLSRFARR